MSEWIKYRDDRGSWHAVRTWTRVPGQAIALCGRTANGPTSATLPPEKGCETCDRAVIRRAERDLSVTEATA